MNMNSKTNLLAKPVLVWEVRSRRDSNVIPLHRPAREEQVEREATTTEWTVGSGDAKEAETVKITMVSSGFGEVVNGNASGNTVKMRLAA
jgi:hypothetical protein